MSVEGDVLDSFVLDSFTRSTRRVRLLYLSIVGVVVTAAGILFATTVARGEINHVHDVPATSSAPRVAETSLNAHPAQTWQSSEATAGGVPYYDGTVITYSAHTVTGRNALTGSPRWSFTRSDRVICDVVQEQNQTVAVFEIKGNCAQVTALNTGTGTRSWERTLFSDGHVVDGAPDVIADEDAITFATKSVIWAVAISSGTDQWLYSAPNGCQNVAVIRGSSGVLASQHCGDGDYLLLRDPHAADTNDDNKVDPVKWRIHTTGVTPIAADGFVAAFDTGSHKVIRYAIANGTVLGATSTLNPAPSLASPPPTAPSQAGPVLTMQAPGIQLLWMNAQAYALNADGTRQLWSLPATTLPFVNSTTDDTAAEPTVTLGKKGAVAVLDPSTGATRATYAVPTAAHSRIIRLGKGFLVANMTSSDGVPMTAVYQ